MKKVIVVMSILALTLGACTTQPKDGAKATQETSKKKTGKKLRTESDSLSYAMGIYYGYNIQARSEVAGKEFNLDYAIAGIKDVMAEQPTLDMNEAVAYLNEYYGVRIPEKKAAEEKEFLESVLKKNPGAVKTESGLIYEVIEQGSDVKATDLRDKVRVMYKGTLKNGDVFDSSYERGDTTQFALNQVIRGWGEGLQLVGEGGKIKLWIPSELGYGKTGNRSIGGSEPLVFDVELFQVIPYEEKK